MAPSFSNMALGLVWDQAMTDSENPDFQPVGCSVPYHCSCGCGAHMECFLWDEDPGATEAEEALYTAWEILDG
jgi:hypothetical protein